MKYVYATFMLISLTLCACSSEKERGVSQSLYESKENNILFLRPSEWKIQEDHNDWGEEDGRPIFVSIQ